MKLEQKEYTTLKEIIEANSGISLEGNKQYLVESRLKGLVKDLGFDSFSDFCFYLKNENDKNTLNRLVDLMTTNETLWFRDRQPFDTLQSALMPEIISEFAKETRDSFRIWSCACSTGQEPYSLAMILLEEFSRHSKYREKSEILATDISKRVVEEAKAGVFESFSMTRGLSEDFKNKYFDQKEQKWHIKDEVKSLIKFDQFNLQNSFALLGKFDVVFCRNVAIYFSTELKKELFRKIFNLLNPNGVLFLGGGESLRAYSDDFKAEEVNGQFIYRKPI